MYFLLCSSGDPILKGNERSKQGSNQESWKARVITKTDILFSEDNVIY